MMETLKDLRKELKKIGFTVKTKSYSEFTSAIFIHNETKKELLFTCSDSQGWELWQPLIDFCNNHKNDLLQIKNNEHVNGLLTFCKK